MKSLIKKCLFFVFKHETVTLILFMIGSFGQLIEFIPNIRPFFGISITFICFCLCLSAMFVIKELEKFDEQADKGSAIAIETCLKVGFPFWFAFDILLFVLN